MAVEGTDAKTTSGADKAKSGHVMVSYEWSHQKTITRVVRSLEARGYKCWFDLDSM